MLYINTNFEIACISNEHHPKLVLVETSSYESMIRLNVRKFGRSLEDIIYEFIKNDSDKRSILQSLSRDDSFLNFKNINFNKIVLNKDGAKVSLAWYFAKYWGAKQLRNLLLLDIKKAQTMNLDYPAPLFGEDKGTSLRVMLLRTSYGGELSVSLAWMLACDLKTRRLFQLYSIINSLNFYKINLGFAKFDKEHIVYGGVNIAWLLAENGCCDMLCKYYLMNPRDFIKLNFNIGPPKGACDTGKTLAWLLARDPEGRKILNSIKIKYPEVYATIDQSALPISGYVKKSVATILKDHSIFARPHIPFKYLKPIMAAYHQLRV